ncbi:MAG: hypothetical protein KFB96_00135 [Thiocapsa sp.]|uniref:hypothetical protein n=1 Tax=Thiocapsa sp. TaxID=2024551 RepID=UPI001BCB68C5|nr:hypothetical protein [Thiocapsa sp.]QVL48994.1 MAG: hypothetical protein KFB96_00135 [Thiocapsa sp.]
MKNLHFGEGMERSRSCGTERFTVLVLIASLAAFLLWLIGTAAERAGVHRRLHPGNGKRRVYSRIFLARLLLLLDSTRDVLDELFATIAPPDQWVASDHDGLLADGAAGG